MNVVLLEDLAVRGFLGEEVQVKPGFARNFLVPNHKAVYATPENKERFIVQRTEAELALMEEKRDFVLFKERAARKPLKFTRKVEVDGTTLEQPLTKTELATAIRKHLKRRVEETDLKLWVSWDLCVCVEESGVLDDSGRGMDSWSTICYCTRNHENRPKGATLKTIGEAIIRVELQLPELLLQAQQGKGGKTTEAVEVAVVIAKDEAARERRPGAAADAEGGRGRGQPGGP